MPNPDHYLDSKKKSIPKCQILITFLKSWFLSWSSKEINTQMQNLDQFLQNLITFLILKRNQYPNVKSWSLYGNLDYFLDLQKKSIPKCKILINFFKTWSLSRSLKEINTQMSNLDHFTEILITFFIFKRNQYPNAKSWDLSWSLKEINTQIPNLDHFLEFLNTFLIRKKNPY